MAGASLLTLIDDIATILDDVALMSKVAAKKTAGVLGDDLALNAQQVAGVSAERELPVVWAVAKGSLRNKLILVPAALLISFVAPWLITPLLMIGGAYLCFEGFEKLAHPLLHSKEEDAAQHQALVEALADPARDMLAFEREKVGGAIRTDFILSAEIIAITLGTVASAPFWSQLTVLSAIALVMTVGVYGLVAAIVKLDDAGLYLSRKPAVALQKLGSVLLHAAPPLMKLLALAGTVAMFMVGGGILVHGLPALHHALQAVGLQLAALPVPAAVLAALLDALVGIVAGALVLLLVLFAQRVLAMAGAAARH